MRKFFILSGVGIILILIIHSLFRIWEESHVAKGVTISVKDSSNSPIPAVIIELRKLELSGKSTVSILLQTNQNGEIYFRRLAPGRYAIMALRLYCDGGKTGANTIYLDIQGQNTKIQYFPCK